MGKFGLCLVLLVLTTPALAEITLEERTAMDQAWVDTMEWVEICTTDKPWRWSDAERLKACLVVEQQLRAQGSCMYSPGVLGIWNGKHCR